MVELATVVQLGIMFGMTGGGVGGGGGGDGGEGVDLAMTVVSRQAGAAAAGAAPMEEVGLPSCTAASLPGSLGPVCGPDPLSGPVSVGPAYLPALSTYASFSTTQMTHGGRQEDNYAVSDLTNYAKSC